MYHLLPITWLIQLGLSQEEHQQKHNKAFFLTEDDVGECRRKVLLAYFQRIPEDQRQGKAPLRTREWYVGRYSLMDEQKDDDDDGGAAQPIAPPESNQDVNMPDEEESSGAAASATPGAAASATPGAAASSSGAAASATPGAAASATPAITELTMMPPHVPLPSRTKAIERLRNLLRAQRAVHEAWVDIAFRLISRIVQVIKPPIKRWRLKQFGSHYYMLALPDSDVDIQLQIHELPPGSVDVDVSMAICETLRRVAPSGSMITDISDSAISATGTVMFKVGGKAVDFRSDVHKEGFPKTWTGARRTSEFLRAAVSAFSDEKIEGIRVFLTWVKGDSALRSSSHHSYHYH